MTYDTTAEQYLEELVDDYMSQRKMFTSLDIANQAKDAGYRIRNYQVADWLVRNAISFAKQNGYLYNQQLITVDSKNVGLTLAYLYHYYLDDSDDYMDRDQNPKSFLSTAQSVPPQSALLQQSGPLFFETRQAARDFARSSVEYKFKDFGRYAPDGERWSCVSA